MVVHQIVDLGVVGSSPITHPNITIKLTTSFAATDVMFSNKRP
jgi:hypothetical protein